jgi:uncharacterized OsmC-like protein
MAVFFMEFPSLLKQATTKTYSDWEAAKILSEEERSRKFASTTRVSVKFAEDLRKELRSGSLSWLSDGSKSEGGKGENPGALQHFLAGLPLCQMTHYAERASVWGIKLESLEMSVEGHFVAVPGYGFDEIKFEARISSQEDPKRIKELAQTAEHDCYVTNTLKRACRVSGRILLNGELLMETGN